VVYGVRLIDGTFVEACTACGFDGSRLLAGQVAPHLGDLAGAWQSLLADTEEGMLRGRPDEATWCALEYAEHIAIAMLWLDDLIEGRVPASGAPPTNDPQDGPDRCSTWSPAGLGADVCSSIAVAINRADRHAHHAGDGSRLVSLGDFELSEAALLRHGAHDIAHHLLDVRRDLARQRLDQGQRVV